MQSPDKKRALIIGAGIGGVTAALALRQAGLAVTVFERAEQLREVGSALPLWMNALRALEKLGITDQVSAIGRPVTSVLSELKQPLGRVHALLLCSHEIGRNEEC